MKKLVLAVIASCFCISANAACDTKSLKGNYMIQGIYTGYKSSYPTTCGDIGIIQFDGKGGAVGVGFESCAGTTYALPKQTGTYQIDALCSGSIVFGTMEIKYIFDKTLKSGVILGANPDYLSSGVGTILKQ